ncbi:porin family protein [uncultured Phocaeicola sp.]|uniref:porin family protein n=1 Tax=uncultured Phocaeicola sp. TaxID=990718 RepID=UPI0030C7828E
MKKLVLILVCAMSALFATAQTKITWNAEVGIGTSMWMGDGSDGSKAIFNPRVGVGIDIPLTGLVSFKTGLHWVSKGAKINFDTSVGEQSVDGKLKVNQNYLQVPLLASFHLGTNKNFDVVLSGGFYLACGVSGKQEISADDLSISWSTFKDSSLSGTTFSQGLRRFDAGVQIGGALDFKHWSVGLNGEFGLCKIVENGPRNLGFYATVGYKF